MLDGGVTTPPRRSSWGFNLRGKKREEEPPPTPWPTSQGNGNGAGPGPGRARSSLSALDDRKATEMRGEINGYMASTRTSVGNGTAAGGNIGDGAGAGIVAKNGNRRSISRPPPAYYNRPYHQRHFSTSALQRSSASSYSYDDLLLKPQAQHRNTSFRGSTQLPPSSTAASGVTKTPAASSAKPAVRGDWSDLEAIMRARRASARVHEATGMDSQPALITPHIDAEAVNEAMPATVRPGLAMDGRGPASMDGSSWHNRPMSGPRRMSNSSTVTTSSTGISSYGRESFENRARSSSFSSQTSFESASHSPFSSPAASPRAASLNAHYAYQIQNQHYAWNRPQPIKPYRRRAKPGEIFAQLPGEVLELILGELRNLHLGPGSTSCATCWMRDCCAAMMSARKFVKYARAALYTDIELNGCDSTVMRKRLKLSQSSGAGSRLVLLRRSLRANLQIAVIVHSLKVPAASLALGEGFGAEEYTQYADLVASVVMACPNFERLAGFYPAYNHAFSRLFHSLSTRQRLKAMEWIVAPSPFQRQLQIRPANMAKAQNQPVPVNRLMVPGDLQPGQSAAFLNAHANWMHLNSLTVHCLPGATLSPDTLLDRTLRYLPALQSLHLSHLPHTAFNDMSLQTLPYLRKLTMSHLPGVTSAGLGAFATRASSNGLTSLTLVHLDIDSLPTIARVFANLSSLEIFNFVQSYPPLLPSDELIMLFPYLASNSLRKLHWDIPYLPTRASAADAILARSIGAGGFPRLRILRAPNDPESVFQSLCRPRERIDGPSDRYRLGSSHYRNGSSNAVQGPHSGSTASFSQRSPTSPQFPRTSDELLMPRMNSDLRQARLAAQARIEGARRFPRYFVNVIDEEGFLVEKFGIGGFLGTVGSKIQYVLTPDAGSSDEAGGLVGVAEMLGDCGEELVIRQKEEPPPFNGMNEGKKKEGKSLKKDRDSKKDKDGDNVQTREGCIGRWNTYSGQVIDKKDKDRWIHTERGRWRGVTLS